MSDEKPDTQEPEATTTDAATESPFAPPPPPPEPAPVPPAAAAPALPTDKPEVLIGGAFAGGFLAAMILKRLGRR